MKWWKELDDVRQRVLANMAFNLGLPRLSKFVNFLTAVQASDWEKAADEMMDSKWANQVGERAIRLRQKMLEGE